MSPKVVDGTEKLPYALSRPPNSGLPNVTAWPFLEHFLQQVNLIIVFTT